MGRRLHALLRERFGALPPPGPARGEYFKTVKSTLSEWGSRNLVARLLKDELITFQDFAVAFPNTKPCDAAALIGQLDFGSDLHEGVCLAQPTSNDCDEHGTRKVADAKRIILHEREAFRDAVFARDGGNCVICGHPAADAHHIIERRRRPGQRLLFCPSV